MRLGDVTVLWTEVATAAAGLYFAWDAVFSSCDPAPVVDGACTSFSGGPHPDRRPPSAEKVAARERLRVALHGNLVAEAPLPPVPRNRRRGRRRRSPATGPECARPGADGRVDGDVTPTLEGRAKAPFGKRGLVILQIGDSHTSADFLTGELRRRLQARYGRGAPGYITAGHPHIGVRSSTLKITASAGWTYKSLQRPDARASEFWLAGYNAIATAAGETMSFASERPQTFDMIEIEAIRQPGGGAIDIKLDGVVETSYDLASAKVEPVVIRLVPERGPTDKVREISITTRATRARSASPASRSTTTAAASPTTASAIRARPSTSSTSSTPGCSRATCAGSIRRSSCCRSAPTRRRTPISTSPPTGELRARDRQDQSGAAWRGHRRDRAPRLCRIARRLPQGEGARKRPAGARRRPRASAPRRARVRPNASGARLRDWPKCARFSARLRTAKGSYIGTGPRSCRRNAARIAGSPPRRS